MYGNKMNIHVRCINGYFMAGFARFMFVKDVIKPPNDNLVMNLIVNQMKIPEEKRGK